MFRGQRAASLPSVHMVVPLPLSTSNSFGPLADTDEQPVEAPALAASSSATSSAVQETPTVKWAEVMASLYARRSIDQSFGMDAGNTEGWMFADHHATASVRDPPAYAVNRMVGRSPEVGKPDLPRLLQTLMNFAKDWKDFDTVYLFVDNRALDTHERPSYWKHFAPWVRERCHWIGPLGERTTAAFVASSWEN